MWLVRSGSGKSPLAAEWASVGSGRAGKGGPRGRNSKREDPEVEISLAGSVFEMRNQVSRHSKGNAGWMGIGTRGQV